MKIDVSGGYSIYRKSVAGENTKTRSASGTAGEKTDVAAFSHGSTAIADKNLLALKSGLQRDISLPASAERLEQLRQEIKNGTYKIPTKALVDSILED